MNKLKGFNWLCVLAFFAGTANADVVIDSQVIPSADVTGISITPGTGQLNISTVGYTVTKNVVGTTNVAISSFVISPSPATAGSSVSVGWYAANATSCTPSGGTGGWQNLTNLSLPSGSKSINVSTAGTYTFTLTCTGSTAGDTDTKSVNLTVNPPGAVSITSFTATPVSVTEGGSTTLSWTTSNATSCTASGGTGGWNSTAIGVPNGSKTVTVSTVGTYTFGLTCQDGSGGTDSKQATVTATAASQCSASSLSGTQTPWENFWSLEWPNPKYATEETTIPKYGYLALEFDTGNVTTSGKLWSIEMTITGGTRLGAISQCPGDFDVAPECQYTWGLSGGLSWATDGTNGCQLAPNTTYYFNLTFTDGENPSSSTCTSSTCWTKLQNYYK